MGYFDVSFSYQLVVGGVCSYPGSIQIDLCPGMGKADAGHESVGIACGESLLTAEGDEYVCKVLTHPGCLSECLDGSCPVARTPRPVGHLLIDGLTQPDDAFARRSNAVQGKPVSKGSHLR